jgi:hypothetical protein
MTSESYRQDLDPRRQSEAQENAIECSARLILRRVFRILKGCGISELELRKMAMSAVNEIVRIPDSQPSRVTARQAMMCCDVILKWRRDYRFVDSSGMPDQLPMANEQNSFESLVNACAPGADAKSLMDAMVELGVVRLIDEKRVELISDSVVTCSGQEGAAMASECVLEHICGFLGSVEFNVFDKPSRAKGRFERACYASVPRELVPVLQQLVNSRGQDFVDVIDEWLSRRSVKTSDQDATLLVGAGAYLFVRENFS